jgi:hypothetical protein
MHRPNESTMKHFVRYTREGIRRTLQARAPSTPLNNKNNTHAQPATDCG